MRKCKTQSLDDILGAALREGGLETPLNQHRIVAAWPKVMGEGIMHYTGSIFVKNQTLYVQIKSPVLKNDLMMGKQNIVRRLNAFVEAQTIENIVFL